VHGKRHDAAEAEVVDGQARVRRLVERDHQQD
jgi:hypothetical protein